MSGRVKIKVKYWREGETDRDDGERQEKLKCIREIHKIENIEIDLERHGQKVTLGKTEGKERVRKLYL